MPGDSAGDNQNELGNGHAQQEGVQWAIALPSGSGLSRDLSDPCNPLLTYAQKPRTEAEEKSCSSHCRAKEADRQRQQHAASVPVFDAASPGAAASNGTASRAAYIKAKTDRDDVMALAPVPVGPE